MECTFQEAIPNASESFWGFEKLPVVGEAYTVREMQVLLGRFVVIRLVEIVNAPANYYAIGTIECAFLHTHFRKVEKPKRETSIEVFKEIDRKVFERQPEKVRA